MNDLDLYFKTKFQDFEIPEIEISQHFDNKIAITHFILKVHVSFFKCYPIFHFAYLDIKVKGPPFRFPPFSGGQGARR